MTVGTVSMEFIILIVLFCIVLFGLIIKLLMLTMLTKEVRDQSRVLLLLTEQSRAFQSLGDTLRLNLRNYETLDLLEERIKEEENKS